VGAASSRLRRILQKRRGEAGDRQHDDDRQQEYRQAGSDEGQEFDRVGAVANANPGGIIHQPAQRRRQLPDAVDGEKAQDDQERFIDEKIEASRETGILPFSTESRIFFSVGSSVLLSRSGASDIRCGFQVAGR
jgi:hypothetical protein